MLFCRLLIFSKLTFSEKFFWKYHQSVKEQARHFIRSDLGSNCLQRLSADALVGKELSNQEAHLFLVIITAFEVGLTSLPMQ